MAWRSVFVGLALLGALLAPPDRAAAQVRPLLSANWDDGLSFQSADQRFRVHVGGSGQVDSVWLAGPESVFVAPGGAVSGVGSAAATNLRRARVRIDGTMHGQFDFIVEYDLANSANENDGQQPPSFRNLTGAPSPADVWMQVRDVPFLGDVRVGHQVKPIGMDKNTSQRFQPFLERADVSDAFFAPFDGGRAMGVSVRARDEAERVTWQYGVYRPMTNVFGVALDKLAGGARITALPVFEEEGDLLAHVGISFWGGQTVQDQLRTRARPLLRNGPGYAIPILVDSGEIPGSGQFIFGPEFAAVVGPLTLQAEWTGQFLTGATVGDQTGQTVFFHGGYLQALWFLTGEHQEYDKRSGAFGRVVPRRDYHIAKGDSQWSTGAWQVGARVGYLNLDDNGVLGGRLVDATFGLNWFLNPNMKFQANYVVAYRQGPPNSGDGWLTGFGIRAAYDF